MLMNSCILKCFKNCIIQGIWGWGGACGQDLPLAADVLEHIPQSHLEALLGSSR